MAKAEIKTPVKPVEKPAIEPEAVQKRWFYVAISPVSGVSKGGAESAAAFKDRIEEAGIAWVDYVTPRDADFDKEAIGVASELGFNKALVPSLDSKSFVNYQDFDTELGMRMPTVQIREMEVSAYPLLMLLKKNFILTIHPHSVDKRFTKLRRYADTVLRKIPLDVSQENKLTLLLMRIIDENNDRNFEHLRQIEERGDRLNETMIDPKAPREKIGPEIYHMKHALITYLNALWDSVHVLHTLRYGDAELITNDQPLLDKLTILAEDVNRQIELAEHMSEVLASGLEVLQSIYNNQLQALNNRLALIVAYLTIIGTAVLVPNTLATIFGNSAFDMGPRDLWWYIPLMIGSTIIATWASFIWIKKSGWLPKKMD
jgi:magnesium transporter